MPGKSAFCLPRVTPGCNLPSGKIHWLRKCDDHIVLMSHIHDNANSTHILSCARRSRKKNVFWHNGNKTQVVGFLIVAAFVSFGDRRERLEGYFHMQDLNVLFLSEGGNFTVFFRKCPTHMLRCHISPYLTIHSAQAFSIIFVYGEQCPVKRSTLRGRTTRETTPRLRCNIFGCAPSVSCFEFIASRLRNPRIFSISNPYV